ncbi:type II/IV secretion system ATPase subunit [Halosegnis sp.]|uniref:type II/IV secretion system ATPase subunit n=1 Tax=Halosegnis sp. TaxID=2864959 RepID=UPI0035D4BD70
MGSSASEPGIRPDGLLARLRRAYESLLGVSVDAGSYRFGDHEPLTDYEVPPEGEEVDRYWVDVPFAYVSIYDDTEEDELRYHVVEPELSDVQARLLRSLKDDIRDHLLYTTSGVNIDADDVLRSQLKDTLEQYGAAVTVEEFHTLLYYIDRDFTGYHRIQPLMNDPHIEDISCDGYNIPIFIYHNEYDDLKTNVQFEKRGLDDLIIRLGQMSDRQLSVAEPISNATLPDGSRAELVYTEEVSPHGSAFTIRQYDEDTMTPVDLIEFGTFTVEQMAYFWLAIENRMNLIFAGGTASGKTTSMNAVSMFLPPGSKVITIEDTREISLAHDNWLANVTRERLSEDANIGMYDLLRSALRHRPEYIIVGEVRGEEALTLFQAMNTGHTTYSTMHADSVQTVINRLENDPINVPRAMVQSLDILSVQTLSRQGDQRVRRADSVVEIGGIDERTGELNFSELYSWNPADDTVAGDYTDSGVLDRIQQTSGWSEREFRQEFRNRRRVIEYLVEEGIHGYEQFTAVINRYARDKESVLDRIDNRVDDVPPAAPED